MLIGQSRFRMQLNKPGTVTFFFEDTAGTQADEYDQAGNSITIFH